MFSESVPNIEVRMGAILSLERIAQDSTIHDKGRDHVRVMEILCAYIRENAPAYDLSETPVPFKVKTPRIDIQLALNVLKRRSGDQIKIEEAERYRIDLRKTNLDGCDLSKGNLQGAMFWGSRLEAASLRHCNLTGTQFQICQLSYVDLSEATLIGTILNGSKIRNLSGYLSDSGKIRGVFVEDADISGLRLGADVLGTKFFGSKDTVVAEHYEERKESGLKLSEDTILENGFSNAINLDGAPTPFTLWNPYTMGDGAAGYFRNRFKRMYDLTGWPFDDD